MFRIDGLGGVKETDKTKAKAKTGSSTGPSFASFLEEAQSADAPADPAPIAGAGGLASGYIPLENEEDAPKDSRGQARALLQTLRDLANDALGGSPTSALPKLEALAKAEGVDESTLTATQKTALDEARTRAAVEAEKLKK